MVMSTMYIKALTSLMKKEKVSHSYLLIQQKASKETNSNTLDILVENHGHVNYEHQGYNKFNEERKGEPVLLTNPAKGFQRNKF